MIMVPSAWLTFRFVVIPAANDCSVSIVLETRSVLMLLYNKDDDEEVRFLSIENDGLNRASLWRFWINEVGFIMMDGGGGGGSPILSSTFLPHNMSSIKLIVGQIVVQYESWSITRILVVLTTLLLVVVVLCAVGAAASADVDNDDDAPRAVDTFVDKDILIRPVSFLLVTPPRRDSLLTVMVVWLTC